MNNNKFKKINYSVITYLLLISSPIIAQETPLSEIFFLDLGIVIEPAKGNESYSRVVDKPSEEVSFKIKKVESGSLLMASSKELLSTLDRVTNRLDKLEKSFQSEMEIMHKKNTELSFALEQLNNFNTNEEKINLVENKIPIIKNNKLAENIEQRMAIFSSFLDIQKYSAMINVGGGVASLGTSFNSKLLKAGIVNRSDVLDISLREGGIEGVLSKFSMKNIPVLHVLNIKSLIEKLNMPFAPIPIPEIGIGGLYAERTYNTKIAGICLFIVSGCVFMVGYQSKKRIKEHLTDHEPDSLL